MGAVFANRSGHRPMVASPVGLRIPKLHHEAVRTNAVHAAVHVGEHPTKCLPHFAYPHVFIPFTLGMPGY